MRLLVATLVATTLMFSGCAETSFETIPSAGWKAGNTFGYVAEGAISVVSHASVDGEVVDDSDESQDFEPTPVFSIHVINTQAKDGLEPLYLALVSSAGDAFGMQQSAASGANGNNAASRAYIDVDVGDGLYAFRQDNLEQLAAQITGKALSVAASPQSFDVIRFPLVYGDTWSTTLDGQGDTDTRIESKVMGMITVAGPYGELKAVRIHHDVSMPGLQAMVDEELEEAQREGLTVDRFDMSIGGSLDVYFAPSLHAIVRQTMDFHSSIDLAVSEDGHDLEAAASARAHVDMTLSQLDLAEAPETPIDALAIEKIEAPALPPVAAPTTQPVGDDASPGTLSATTATSLVNAADEPSVTFTAQASGALGPVKWRLYDGAGVIVLQGEGTEFTTAIDRPGLYQASFTAYDFATKSTLSANVPLQADYHVAAAPAECPTVSIGTTQCDGRAIPLGPGLTSLTVLVERTALAIESGVGELRVLQGGEVIATTDLEDNTATLTFGPEVVAGGDIEMRYVATAGVSDALAYTVEGTFGTPTTPTAPQARAFAFEQMENVRAFV